MLTPIFSTHGDILRAVVAHLSPQGAAQVSEVNRFCRLQVSPLLPSRFGELVRACPWASAPQVMKTCCRSMGWDSTRMTWRLLADSPNLLEITADTMWNGVRTFTLPRHPGGDNEGPTYVDDPGAVFRLVTPTPPNPFQPLESCHDLVQAHAIRSPQAHERVLAAPLGPDALLVVIQRNNYMPYAASELSVVDRATRRLLRRVGTIAKCRPPVLVGDGEFWVVDDQSGRIHYYGPRQGGEQQVLSTDPAGRVWSARILAGVGRVKEAVDLLARRADLIDLRFKGETILLAMVTEALARGAPLRRSALRLLRDRGADFDAATADGITVLGWAAAFESVTSARMLMEGGAAADVRLVAKLYHACGCRPKRSVCVAFCLLTSGG